jgi:DNA-binding PadR family transcriptional regulator
MTFILGQNISPFSKKLIETLFVYRGTTAIQIAEILFPVGYSLSQEKSVYNYLSKLKKKKLVASRRLQGSFSKGSIYYLTEAGLTLAKNLLNINLNQTSDGWIQFDYLTGDGSTMADLSYELYRPPLKQTDHHLLLIELFTRLNALSFKIENLNYRLNIYAAHSYETEDGLQRYRPDAELRFGYNSIHTIEIDRGTESHEQLRMKFRTYREYFDYLSKEEKPLPKGILFVTEEKRRYHGMKRRWVSIAAAFFEEIGQYHKSVNLIFASMDQIDDVVRVEANRQHYETLAAEQPIKFLGEYEKKTSYTAELYDFKIPAFSNVLFDTDEFDIVFKAFSHEYETSFYSKFGHFINSWINKGKQDFEEFIFKDHHVAIYHSGEDKPFVIGDYLKNFDIDENLKMAFEKIGPIVFAKV